MWPAGLPVLHGRWTCQNANQKITLWETVFSFRPPHTHTNTCACTRQKNVWIDKQRYFEQSVTTVLILILSFSHSDLELAGGCFNKYSVIPIFCTRTCNKCVMEEPTVWQAMPKMGSQTDVLNAVSDTGYTEFSASGYGTHWKSLAIIRKEPTAHKICNQT